MAARTALGADRGGVSEFLARRATEALGLGLLAVALLVAVALWGYDPNDPSLNHAIGGPSSNPLGRLGASIADVAQQTLGLAAWLVVVILPLWAVRLILGRHLAWPWVPLMSLPLALLAGAAWLATRPLPDSWPFWVGLGGFVGDYMLHRLERPIGPEIYPTITGSIALVLAILAAGLSVREIWQAARALLLAPWRPARRAAGRQRARRAALGPGDRPALWRTARGSTPAAAARRRLRLDRRAARRSRAGPGRAPRADPRPRHGRHQTHHRSGDRRHRERPAPADRQPGRAGGRGRRAGAQSGTGRRRARAPPPGTGPPSRRSWCPITTSSCRR